MKTIVFLTDFNGNTDKFKNISEGDVMDVEDNEALSLTLRGIAQYQDLEVKQEKHPVKTKEEKHPLKKKEEDEELNNL